MSRNLLCLALLSLIGGTDAFSIQRSTTSMKMSVSTDSRRNFLNQIATTTATVVAAASAAPAPAFAISGKNRVNAKLQSYGLPAAIVPDGLTPLVDIYGKGKNRFPILVTFSHPPDWVVTYPSNDVNGEDGTIQAGEYAKGDTATFFLYSPPGNVKNLEEKGKDFYSECLEKAISQKGANMYQSFKVTKTETMKTELGQTYVVCDFKYQLLTGAGFEVDRNGVASITSQGDAIEVLWSATIRQRYKKMEPVLRNIAGSFRCYTDGLQFSNDLITNRPDVF